ncbi:MAG TPA: cobalt-precorrin-6A reductase [Alphaproteobacteria bacterium]|nr:cobalt-precorrin-6A reductase [Alphaproteobacteria bacterium]
MRLLILGGTTEASALARAVDGWADLDPILSLAGRTQNPVIPPIPYRTGGFGGVDGLKTYLTDDKIDAVIDATHPFAAQMSANAAEACGALNIPLALFTRAAWRPVPGDRWIQVADMGAAARALGETPRRVFLTVGGLQLAAFADAPQHHYLVRTIDPPEAIAGLPDHRVILARGPFTVDDETVLMRDERIDLLVTKNSGGKATAAKLAAARALDIEVIMVERPKPPEVEAFETLDAITAWALAHRPTP